MREFIFKAKRLDNGQWIEGQLISECDRYHNQHAYIVSHKHPSSCFGGDIYIEVDPRTVCQYTGIDDVNGNRIFENDLLDGFDYPYMHDGEHNYFAEAVWFNNIPAFGLVVHKYKHSEVNGLSEGESEFFYTEKRKKWQIIGNVFDDPELLEDMEWDD